MSVTKTTGVSEKAFNALKDAFVKLVNHQYFIDDDHKREMLDPLGAEIDEPEEEAAAAEEETPSA